MSTSDVYYYSYEEDKSEGVPEPYEVLRGPNGFTCRLGEPEDRIWSRDLDDVVKELNRLHRLSCAVVPDGEVSLASLKDAWESKWVGRRQILEKGASSERERLICYSLVAMLPDDAILEAVESLHGIRDHYSEIAAAKRQATSRKEPPVVEAKVFEQE